MSRHGFRSTRVAAAQEMGEGGISLGLSVDQAHPEHRVAEAPFLLFSIPDRLRLCLKRETHDGRLTREVLQNSGSGLKMAGQGILGFVQAILPRGPFEIKPPRVNPAAVSSTGAQRLTGLRLFALLDRVWGPCL